MGQVVAAYWKKSMVLKWKNKKDVCFMSTLHDDFMMQVKSRHGKKVNKPKAVANYNSNMGGVDLFDNLMVYFLTARNSQKNITKKYFVICWI